MVCSHCSQPKLVATSGICEYIFIVDNLKSINTLINCFTKLSGIGYKMAERCAYRIIEKDETFAKEFSNAILEVKQNIKICKKCGNFCENEFCKICENRRSDTICVVKDPRDVISLEKSGVFGGVYHVLHGVISPLDKKGPNDLNLKSLIVRVRDEKIREVIIATNPDIEGEATANYIASLLKPAGILVTRLAQGLALGSNLEYADNVTLGVAITNRVAL